MRHVEIALRKLKERHPEKNYDSFITIDNIEDVKGIAPVVNFAIQSDPIGEVGVNGVQATDMLEYVKYLFKSLDEIFPCQENKATIEHIEKSLYWQKKRTDNRIQRKVEGFNLA